MVDALRDFQRAGGLVVAFGGNDGVRPGRGRVNSGGPDLLVAAAYATVAPDARMMVHGADLLPGADGAELKRLVDAFAVELFSARTWTPRESLQTIMSAWGDTDRHTPERPSFYDVSPADARSGGWVDFVCTYREAVDLAAQIACGERPQSARRRFLDSRGEAAEPPRWREYLPEHCTRPELVRSLDGEASTSGSAQAGLAWYRGNVDTTLNGGAPLIYDLTNGDRVTLTIFGSCGNVSISSVGNWAQAIPLQITIQPKTNLDNLDALRLISLKFYSSAGSFREEIRIPVTDRAYGSAGSPTNALNALVIRQVFFAPGAQGDFTALSPFHFNGYIRVTLYNAYGVSASRDFGSDGNVAGADMAVNVTIPGVTGTGVSGGGGSNYCPAPGALILLEDGSTVAAAELRDGMRVQGFQDNGTGAPAIGTIRYAAIEPSRSRYLLTLADGRQMHFSKDHRLWSATKGEWVVVQQLSVGEELQGATTNSFVASVAADGPGPVIGFVVEDTHTYFADGLLSHNVKSSVP
jgi:hypothetical protein